MQTIPTLSRAQLRSAIEDEAAPPRARLDAAEQLLAHFGLSARNERILKRVVREFAKFIGEPRTQMMIRERAERLKASIKQHMGCEQTKNVNQVESLNVSITAAIANPDSVSNADLSTADLEKHFDWRGEGRTDLRWIDGVDLVDRDHCFVPHPEMLERLLQIFEPDLPVDLQYDKYDRARKVEYLWHFEPTQRQIDDAEQRLKTGPWLVYVKDGPEAAPQLRLTELGIRRRFLNLIRTRMEAGLTIFGKPALNFGSL